MKLRAWCPSRLTFFHLLLVGHFWNSNLRGKSIHKWLTQWIATEILPDINLIEDGVEVLRQFLIEHFGQKSLQ